MFMLYIEEDTSTDSVPISEAPPNYPAPATDTKPPEPERLSEPVETKPPWTKPLRYKLKTV